MSANPIRNYSDTCSKLTTEIQNLSVRVRVSESNMKLQENYSEKLRKAEESIKLCNCVLDVMKPMIGDIEKYIGDKRKESMQSINKALQMAGEIIQDSTEGIHFEVEGDEAWLSTPKGLEVEMVEGGGFRQISSVFVQAVVLAANYGKLKTLLLDEMFSLVSVSNSSVLSLYLNVMCQNMQIMCIEQKPEVFSNIDYTMYSVEKGTDYAIITKKDIKREICIKEGVADESEAD